MLVLFLMAGSLKMTAWYGPELHSQGGMQNGIGYMEYRETMSILAVEGRRQRSVQRQGRLEYAGVCESAAHPAPYLSCTRLYVAASAVPSPDWNVRDRDWNHSNHWRTCMAGWVVQRQKGLRKGVGSYLYTTTTMGKGCAFRRVLWCLAL